MWRDGVGFRIAVEIYWISESPSLKAVQIHAYSRRLKPSCSLRNLPAGSGVSEILEIEEKGLPDIAAES